ncbi:7527_t:CDS:10, partial [Gigaspora rosea]
MPYPVTFAEIVKEWGTTKQLQFLTNQGGESLQEIIIPPLKKSKDGIILASNTSKSIFMKNGRYSEVSLFNVKLTFMLSSSLDNSYLWTSLEGSGTSDKTNLQHISISRCFVEWFWMWIFTLPRPQSLNVKKRRTFGLEDDDDYVPYVPIKQSREAKFLKYVSQRRLPEQQNLAEADEGIEDSHKAGPKANIETTSLYPWSPQREHDAIRQMYHILVDGEEIPQQIKHFRDMKFPPAILKYLNLRALRRFKFKAFQWWSGKNLGFFITIDHRELARQHMRNTLSDGIHIVVATPDRMNDMGFEDDVKNIMSYHGSIKLLRYQNSRTRLYSS